jgi:hypothetical protein|tara:strand:+ start:431 stop:646 length:216 start_codon:yes stop_codon:yes gene_type:complete
MFFSIVLACTSPSVLSCTVFANVNDTFPTKEECLISASKVKDNFLKSGVYAKAGCFKMEDIGISIKYTLKL